MTDVVSLRQRVPLVGASISLVCVLLLAATPIVSRYFHDYLAGYIAEIAALAIAYYYATRFRLVEKYRSFQQLALLAISFAIPLDNLLIPKILRKALLGEHILLEVFRPTILALIAIVAISIWRKKRPSLPLALSAAAVLSIVAWIVASALSAYPWLSLGYGFFEMVAVWLALYALRTVAPDREFLLHAAALFCIAFMLVGIAQSVTILTGPASPLHLRFPWFADQFLSVKMDVPLMTLGGDNGYGNPDNFAFLWCLVVVLLAGAPYMGRLKIWAWLAFAVTFYTGLLIYPRSALLSALLGLVLLWIYRLRSFRSGSTGLIVTLVIIVALHLHGGVLGYYFDGISSFAEKLAPHHVAMTSTTPAARLILVSAEAPPKNLFMPDSGTDRASAWAKGFSIGKANWISGVGYGVYPIIEPQFTAPHSMALERLAEGGLLSIASFLILAGWCFWSTLRCLLRRQRDMIGATAIIAASVFLINGSLFGAAFSIGGLIPWGFAMAICVAMYLRTEPRG